MRMPKRSWVSLRIMGVRGEIRKRPRQRAGSISGTSCRLQATEVGIKSREDLDKGSVVHAMLCILPLFAILELVEVVRSSPRDFVIEI